MRGSSRGALAASLLITGTVAAAAEPGSFFKDLFSGGGQAPSLGAPMAQDPGEVYCPAVTVADGAAALQTFAGAPGDSTRLRHQLVFGQVSRECTARDGGAVAVKVGLQVRALLGPAGAAGTFDAPLIIAIKYNDKILAARTRRVSVAVPPGGAQGAASVIEADLVVPADMAIGYDIEIGLGGHAQATKPPKVAAKHRKPAVEEATAGTPAGEPPPVQ